MEKIPLKGFVLVGLLLPIISCTADNSTVSPSVSDSIETGSPIETNRNRDTSLTSKNSTNTSTPKTATPAGTPSPTPANSPGSSEVSSTVSTTTQTPQAKTTTNLPNSTTAVESSTAAPNSLPGSTISPSPISTTTSSTSQAASTQATTTASPSTAAPSSTSNAVPLTSKNNINTSTTHTAAPAGFPSATPAISPGSSGVSSTVSNTTLSPQTNVTSTPAKTTTAVNTKTTASPSSTASSSSASTTPFTSQSVTNTTIAVNSSIVAPTNSPNSTTSSLPASNTITSNTTILPNASNSHTTLNASTAATSALPPIQTTVSGSTGGLPTLPASTSNTVNASVNGSTAVTSVPPSGVSTRRTTVNGSTAAASTPSSQTTVNVSVSTSAPLPITSNNVNTQNGSASTQTVPPTSSSSTIERTTLSGNRISTAGHCNSKECGNGTCNPSSGMCQCHTGFTGIACDIDIDECSNEKLNNCSTNAACSNTDGSFVCTCKHGWQGNGYSCTDIDECHNDTLNNCSTNADCSNTNGSFVCTCKHGWHGDGYSCTDINECYSNSLNNCSTNADCLNTNGSFTCACKNGWQGDGYSCTDIDECRNDTLINCSKNANCSNTDGSYTCTCSPGWKGDGINCTDIDECSGTSPCDIWANCTNIEGSYSCNCGEGFEGNGHSCTDVDECHGNGTNSCITNNTKECINLAGKYFCLCENGWKGQHCDAVNDLCNASVNPCSPNATCSYNTSGVFCVCKDQFRGNGTTCYQKVLLEQYKGGTKLVGDDDIYGPYNVPGGIPFNGKVFSNIYVSMNGYISLGQRLNMRYPNMVSDSKLLNDVDFPVIAPLWADIETDGKSSLFINTTLNVTEINQYFSDEIHNPRFAFMATWKSAVPYPYQVFKNSEKADFQVVLLTNGSSTKLMLNYDQEYFMWKVSAGRKVAIGFSGINKTWVGLADQDNFTEINKMSEISNINGRLEFDIPAGNQTVLLGESMCFKWLQNVNVKDLNESLSTASACPCSISQAQRDRQFQTYDGLKYESRFPRGEHMTTQNCKYSNQGALLTGAPNGGFITVPSLEIEDGFLHCCEQSSRFCQDFYKKVPSQDCSGYEAPSWTLTWGDPHLQTIDGGNYTFNGRGEYTLLKYVGPDLSEKTEVQVRTDYVNENTSATVFVGLAATLGDNNTLEINLNRSKEILNIYINGVKNNTFDGTNPVNMTSNTYMIFNERSSLTVSLKMGISVLVKFSNILDITTSVSKDVKLKGNLVGLLGNNDDDPSNDFISRNGTYYSSYNQSTIYEFASTWRVNETTSLFNYSLSGKTFRYYNNMSLPDPPFFDDLNITEYILETCGSPIDLTMCDGNQECIIDTAAACNSTFGATTKQTAEVAEEEANLLENKPPSLDDLAPAILYLGYNFKRTVSLTPTEYFSNDSRNIQVLNVSTFSEKAFTYENGIFKLNISSLDRGRHFSFFVKFIAEDDLNATTEYWPSVYYCPCEKEEYCDYSLLVERITAERFFVASCNCSDDSVGQYCESKSCNRYNATEACDAGCPVGMEAVDGGDKCYDVDECEEGRCQQKCENIIGSFNCSCENGYVLNKDGKTCDDVNECLNNTTVCSNEGQYCENIPGNYTCKCSPGYMRINESYCSKVFQSFAGKLEISFVRTRAPENLETFAKNWITDIFSSSIKAEFSVEIISAKEISTSRKKRQNDNSKIFEFVFVLHTANQTSVAINMTLNDYRKRHEKDVFVDAGDPFVVVIESAELYSDEENGICNIPDKTDCDSLSTDCRTEEGNFHCECKQGFEVIPSKKDRCKDINECQNESICKSSDGNCTNIPGSYVCTCQPGFVYEDLTCKDLCQPNPCNNDGECLPGNSEGQFICKCGDKWTGVRCETENSELSRLRIIAIAVGASVGCLCLLLLCVMLGMYRRSKARRLGYSRRPLSTYDDLSLPHTSQFLKRDIPLDDDNVPDESTFSIPRARLRASEYATIEDQSSTKGTKYDAYAEKDNDDHRLTSSKRRDDDDDDSEKFGKSNPSYLHRDGTDRPQSTKTRRNPYEYF